MSETTPDTAPERVCTWCGATVTIFCPTCMEAFPSRPHPATMSPDERVAEMEQLGGIVEVPFDLMHARFQALLNRPVWTHEFALNWEGLLQEARWETAPASMEEIIALIPPEKVLLFPFGSESAPDPEP